MVSTRGVGLALLEPEMTCALRTVILPPEEDEPRRSVVPLMWLLFLGELSQLPLELLVCVAAVAG